MSKFSTTQAAADSGETQNPAEVDKATSAVEIHREPDVQYTESDAETMCEESNGSETSHHLHSTSDSDDPNEMNDIPDVMTNAETEARRKRKMTFRETVKKKKANILQYLTFQPSHHVEVDNSLLMQSDESDVYLVDAKKNTPLHSAEDEKEQEEVVDEEEDEDEDDGHEEEEEEENYPLMSELSTTKATADSGETQKAADVDKACSSFEIHRESNAKCTESDAETLCVDSNVFETSELSYTTSYFEETFIMDNFSDSMINVEEEEEKDEKEDDEDVNEEEEEQSPSPLHLAAKDDQVEAVRSLLLQSNGSDVNAVDTKKNTPLHYAATVGQKDVVDLLLSNNSRVDSGNEFGQTPLHLASEKGHTEIVDALIRYGADVNECNNDIMTPLHLASKYGHTESVKTLISGGAAVNESNDVKLTPLHLASENGHKETVEALILHGAGVNEFGKFNMTPLHLASKNGHKETIEALIRHGADVNGCKKFGMTPLHLASKNGHKEIVEGLIRHGAAVNECNGVELTPLHLASENGHKETVEALIRHGADVNGCTKFGMTPLHLASEKGHKETVEALIRHGAGVNEFGKINTTPLHLASKNGHTQIIESLIRHGADVNGCKEYGMTPLHIAASWGDTSSVVILLDNHATVDVMKQSAKTPFYLAAEEGHAEIVDELLLRGVSDFKLPEDERTPLHFAVKYGNAEIVKVILKHSGRMFDKFKEDGYKPQENVRNFVEMRDIEPVELTNSDGRCISAGIVWAETTMPLEIMEDSAGYTALELAARYVRPKMVKMLLDANQCLYSEKHVGDSFRCLKEALSEALWNQPSLHFTRGTFDAFDKTYANKCKNTKKIAEVLVKSDIFNVNYQGTELNTPLHEVLNICYICFYGYPIKKSKKLLLQIHPIDDIIKLLLEKGADFNMKNSDGETALMVASKNGCRHAVQIMLDWEKKSGKKLDLDARDQFGVTALIKAAAGHHVEIVHLLLNNKASVNLHDYYGFTALHAAIYEPNRNWFHLHFFCRGLEKRCGIRGFIPICDRRYPFESQFIGHEKKTTEYKEEIVKLLLDIDETNVNALDFRGNTPLDLAVKSSMRINSATFNELENRGAIENLRESRDEETVHMDRTDERGRSPLHRLIISRASNYAIEDIKAELEHKEFHLAYRIHLKKENFTHLANVRDDKGRTPLHYAVMPPHRNIGLDSEAVRVLLELGCNVNATDIYDKTPLHYAEEYFYAGVNDGYKLLLNCEANENTKDVHGYTPRKLKQLRDQVKSAVENARNCPVRMNTVYMSREINTNHVTELSKQKIATTIKICSKTSRSPESSEEALWNVWIQNEFIRLNRCVRQLKTPLQHFMDRLAHSIKEKDWRFECQPILVGSADEETKTIVSGDFDYNLKLTKFSQLCEVFPHPLGSEGYFQLKRKSKDDTKSRNDEAFDCFFNSDQCLLTGEVNSRFKIILEEVLSDPYFWKGEHLFEWDITGYYYKQSEKPTGLCEELVLRMLHPIDDGEGGSLFVNISIDVVACVCTEDRWPRDPLPADINTTEKIGGRTFVFDRPRFDPFNPRVDHFLFSETFARISFASVESRIIKESSPLIKAAYMVCKNILYDQPKATYQLKNCLLFCMEALNAKNGSDTRKEDNITRTKLAFWVERIMFCFMEFCRHDVYPCYLMPSFRQKVIIKEAYLRINDSDGEMSCSEFPMKYSQAFDIYLAICPDDTTIDIPILHGWGKRSLNAKHDPMWEQFDRDEFIRKLSSRSSR